MSIKLKTISDTLNSFIQTLTTRPGVYSMVNVAGEVIYVGKAKNLKKRVSSYFHRQLDSKTLQLVKQIHSIEVTVTRNEREALLLESNLIKALKPRYNVIFRDDKSYAYLYLSSKDKFPRLSFYRGKKDKSSKYFGPYPSSRLAREALNFLQRIFKLRHCDNSFFNNRVRPCLQYQIKRCTAPCVGYINEEDYRAQVKNAVLFLEGKSQQVINQLLEQMDVASQQLDYEQAAKFRDQIALLRSIQEQQIIFGKSLNIDVLGIAVEGALACIHVLVIRDGVMRGTRHYFPDKVSVLEGEVSPAEELLEAFILQHYLLHEDPQDLQDLPKEILIGFELKHRASLVRLMSEQLGKSIGLTVAKRGVRLQWLSMANQSATAALKGRLKYKIDLTDRFEALQEALVLTSIPQRIECFDVSHTQGEATVAACVVFDPNGPLKMAYRRFNIRGLTPGDDYGALRQALTRHYTRLKSEGRLLADVLLIDGGKGQLAVAEAVLQECQVSGLSLIAVAKGPGRKAGLETLYLDSKGQQLSLSPDSKAFHLIQQIRDEAHRFAITAHRNQRSKRVIHSRLEDIPGVGQQRRIALLKQFGGLQEVLQASIEELSKVQGISRSLASQIYQALHGE